MRVAVSDPLKGADANPDANPDANRTILPARRDRGTKPILRKLSLN
jgi:hypothetical protein